MTIPEKKRKAILERWRAGVIAGYAPDTARFLESGNDAFANPVGAVIARTLGPIVDWLVGAAGEDAMQHALEELMRVRSVQASSASQAVAFVFILRGTVEEILADDMETALLSAARSRIDELALRAFDCYADCRDRINTIKMREVQAEKERMGRVIRAMNRHSAGTGE
jgi:hypothetical protein